MATVNKNHYYYSIDDFAAIIKAHFSYEDEAVGKSVDWYGKHCKAVWDAKFRLYTETENILEKVQDVDCPLTPLYRGLGQEDDDFIFATREEALREYEAQIGQAIADREYNL